MIFSLENFLNEIKIKNFKFFLIFILLFSSLIQYYISGYDIETLKILIIININSLITFTIIFNKKNLISNLIAVLMIFIANFFYSFGPLLLKTLLLKEIKTNLDYPLDSFILVFYVQLILILSFFFSIKTNFSNGNIEDKVFYKFKAFNYLSYNSCLVFFLVLFINKLFLNLLDRGSLSFSKFGDIYMKMLYGLESFFYLPIIYSFYLFFNKKIISKKNFIFFLILNFLIFIFFALVSNSRQELLMGSFVIFICFSIYYLYSENTKFKFNLKYVLIILIFFYLILTLVSNAVLNSRSMNDKITSLELFKYSIGKNELDESQYIPNNSENYIDDPLLGRFTQIKYIDKTLYESSFLTSKQLDEFKNFSFNRMLAFLPQNFIQLFLTDYSKEDYFLSTGSYIEKRTGILISDSKMSHGSFIIEIILITKSYLISGFILFFLFFLIFKILLKFQHINKHNIVYSPLLILIVYDLGYLIGADSLLTFTNTIVRMPIQYLLINYLIIKFFSKKNEVLSNW